MIKINVSEIFLQVISDPDRTLKARIQGERAQEENDRYVAEHLHDVYTI